MPTWKEWKRQVDGDLTMIVKERMDLRNRQGALEWMVIVERDGAVIHHERHSQSTWLGHAHGQLLLPLIAERARARAPAGEATPTATSN